MGSACRFSENGKKCRHCEVQTRHSDLDFNENDRRGTLLHRAQVWLHLHLQLNRHLQIYWTTSAVCCLATKTRPEHARNGKGDGKTKMKVKIVKSDEHFFVKTQNLLIFFFYASTFWIVLLRHENNVRSRNIILNYYSNGQKGGGTFILKYIFSEISLRTINIIWT